MSGQPFPGAAAPFKKGGGRAKPAPGSKFTSAKHVRDAVAAIGKVPAEKQDAAKKKVIGHARRLGAMQHIPPAWMSAAK